MTCADIHFLSLAADLPKTVGPSLTGGVVLPPVAGDFVDQRASYRDADGTRCGGEVIGAHVGDHDHFGQAASCGKAVHISAEGNQ